MKNVFRRRLNNNLVKDLKKNNFSSNLKAEKNNFRSSNLDLDTVQLL